jgi:putative ABC transport system permease protein
MNKKLIKQIRNEWRSNVWIFTELLIVSVIMWFIADYMFVEASNYYSPRGFDISHCYLITLNKLTQNSQEYNPNDTSVSDNKAENTQSLAASARDRSRKLFVKQLSLRRK